MTKSPLAVAVLSASMALAMGSVLAAGQYGTQGQSGTTDSLSGSQAGLDKSFSELDVNMDGVVSQDEALQSEALGNQFTAADVNQDGTIDRAEFSAFEDSIAADGSMGGGMGTSDPGMGGAAGGTSGDLGTGGDMSGTTSYPSFSQLDMDGDGMISRDEALNSSSLDQAFTDVDVNQDGNIDQSEFAAFETNMGEPMTSPGAGDMGGTGSTPGSNGSMSDPATGGTGGGSNGSGM